MVNGVITLQICDTLLGYIANSPYYDRMGNYEEKLLNLIKVQKINYSLFI
jgi:hypothetical protein